MKFYRQLSKIKAISFDLDDTLYSNKPVMLAIEKKMISYFSALAEVKNQVAAQSRGLDQHFWSPFRRQAIINQPNLSHDVVQVRLITYQLGFISLGLTTQAAQQQAQAALNYFIQLRSDFSVPEQSQKLLASLDEITMEFTSFKTSFLFPRTNGYENILK